MKYRDGADKVTAYVRGVEQNILPEDRARNGYIFRDNLFDLRSNGPVKRFMLLVWATPLICWGLFTCTSALNSVSSVASLATCFLVGVPAIAASLMAIWTAFFLRPRGRHYTRRQGLRKHSRTSG